LNKIFSLKVINKYCKRKRTKLQPNSNIGCNYNNDKLKPIFLTIKNFKIKDESIFLHKKNLTIRWTTFLKCLKW